LAASVNSTADFQNKYAYDALSRMTQVTQQSQAGGNSVASKRVDFAYNGVGQYTSVTRSADLAGTQLVASSTYGYDGDGRITSLAHAKGGTTFNSYTWSYDAMSRPTQQTSNDGTDAYSYDASSQVTGATHTSQANESLTYDANGNRTVSGYSTGTNNRLNSDGTYNYQYDAEGNRTRRTEISTGKYDIYAWDNHNRLTSIASYTADGVLTKQVAYTYDLFDRRIGRQVDADDNGAYDTTQRFVYDGEDVVLAYNAAGADKKGTGPFILQTQGFSEVVLNKWTCPLFVSPNVDEILADENESGTVTWSLADNLGSVRDLVQYNSGTNTTSVVNHVLYDTFGQIKSQTNSTWQPLFAYTGREWDGDAGMYYYRARWYDARVGRFLSEDPLGFAAGDVNLSRYVANSATFMVDPSGLGVIRNGDFQNGFGGTILDTDSVITTSPVADSENTTSYDSSPFVIDHIDHRELRADLSAGGYDSIPFVIDHIDGVGLAPREFIGCSFDLPTKLLHDGNCPRADEAVRVFRPRTIGDEVHDALDHFEYEAQRNGGHMVFFKYGLSPFIKTLIPKGRGDLVYVYPDGTRYIRLDGELSAGEMAGQAMVLAPLIFRGPTPPMGKSGGSAGNAAPKSTVGAKPINPSTLPLPNGYSNKRFGDVLQWPSGSGDATAKMRMAHDQLKKVGPDMIDKLRSEGVSSDMLKQWAEFYRAEAIRVPQNPTAAARAFYLDEILKRMGY
jgi:RHS repeat-associated protein